MAATKFAARRQQYLRAQTAMIANEQIIKGLRRELATYVKNKAPAISDLLPEGRRHPQALRVEIAAADGRTSAAHKPFEIHVTGMSSWHQITDKEIRAIVKLMKADGWNYLGDESTTPTGHFWTLKFN